MPNLKAVALALALACGSSQTLPAQSPAVITGRVVVADSAPVAGASVRIDSLSTGTLTGADGMYRLVIPGSRLPRGRSIVVGVSRLGLATASRTAELAPGDSIRMDFRLTSASVSIEGMVVTGLGTERGRSSLATSAIRSGTGGGGAPGRLTAGVLDDFGRGGWVRYRRFLQREDSMGRSWSMTPAAVLLLKVRDRRGAALRDHPVRIRQGGVTHEVRTGVDGVARVFPGLQHRLEAGDFTAEAAGGVARTLILRPEALRYGRPVFDLTGEAALRTERRLDIGFAIDATGSMSDELTYLQTELRDIVARVAGGHRGVRIRVSVVFYRDRGDEFVTRSLPFTEDIDRVVAFLSATEAGGGGDYPEEMNEALRVMLGQEWTEGPAARMLFVLGDAPPHFYEDARYTYHDAVSDAARRGIGVFPLAASGVDRPTEYLMRAMAVMTGGKYVFLTDDSGIGLPHLTPRAPYRVRPLNDLLVGEIRRYAHGLRGGPSAPAQLAARR